MPRSPAIVERPTVRRTNKATPFIVSVTALRLLTERRKNTETIKQYGENDYSVMREAISSVHEKKKVALHGDQQ